MTHNEFTNLSGVTVSQRYYQNIIEPEYTHGNTDKSEFCTDWVKRNKPKLCKAVISDLDALNLDLCLMECHKSDATRSREELETERKARSDAENESARKDITIEELKTEVQDLTERLDRMIEDYNSVHQSYRELLELKTEIAERDTEIVKLKAMLFDLVVCSK
jgi:chromosome segregation ATPase